MHVPGSRTSEKKASQSVEASTNSIPLLDVQGRDEIALDFSIDDTTGGDREDALVGMSFHVPREATGYPAEHEDIPSTDVRVSSTAFTQLSKMPCMTSIV